MSGNERPYVLRPGLVLRHHRTGSLYTVLHLGYLSANAEGVVVYQASRDGSVWVRPIEEFYDLIPQPESGVPTPVRRFWPEED